MSDIRLKTNNAAVVVITCALSGSNPNTHKNTRHQNHNMLLNYYYVHCLKTWRIHRVKSIRFSITTGLLLCGIGHFFHRHRCDWLILSILEHLFLTQKGDNASRHSRRHVELIESQYLMGCSRTEPALVADP